MARLFNRKKSDPMWEHFINQPLADPNVDLAGALTDAGEGRVFPVRSNDPDPAVMSANLKHLARWWGADLVGIVPLSPGQDPGEDLVDPPDAAAGREDSLDGPQPESAGGDAATYRFAVVCALFSEHDPAAAKGIGGRFVLQRGAVVVQHLGAFIRETGFRAAKGAFDPVPLAELAGLGKVDRQGNLRVNGRREYVHVTQAVATNLPLAAVAPPGPGSGQ